MLGQLIERFERFERFARAGARAPRYGPAAVRDRARPRGAGRG